MTFQRMFEKNIGIAPNFYRRICQFYSAFEQLNKTKNIKLSDIAFDNLIADGGSEGRCGWLKDKFGVSWQVVPSVLPELLSNPDKAEKVTQAYLKMNKFDIKTLESA